MILGSVVASLLAIAKAGDSLGEQLRVRAVEGVELLFQVIQVLNHFHGYRHACKCACLLAFICIRATSANFNLEHAILGGVWRRFTLGVQCM